MAAGRSGSPAVRLLAGLWPLLLVVGLPRHSRFVVTKAGVVQFVENRELHLNVKGGAMAAGDPLILWPCSAQSHEIFDLGDGVITLRVNPLLCLNAKGGVWKGTAIVTWPCSHRGRREANEEFTLGEDGRIRLRSRPDLCINVKEGVVELGARLILWPCGEAPSDIRDVFTYHDGLIQLEADHEYHLNVQGGDNVNSAPVVLWRCEPSRHEVFEFTSPDNRIRLKHKPEMCVNAEGGLALGSRLIIWPCHAVPEVNERFVYDREQQVILAQVVRTLAFNVKAGNVQNGGEVILWTIDEAEL